MKIPFVENEVTDKNQAILNKSEKRAEVVMTFLSADDCRKYIIKDK